jgi:hypothetical protein
MINVPHLQVVCIAHVIGRFYQVVVDQEVHRERLNQTVLITVYLEDQFSYLSKVKNLGTHA